MNILEIQLLCPDIEQTRRFYHNTLGMDILFADETILKLSAGLSTLVFKKTEATNANYHFAFNIPANQFAEAHAWASAIVPIISVKDGDTIADFRNWNAKAFYFYDNNQNVVEFIARFDLNNHSNRPFDGSSVTSISEIGIVVDHAKRYAEQLIQSHNLDYFYRQPPQDDFIVLGDDNGLFIVVNNKRTWYPTNLPAGKYWAAIKFSQGGELKEITMQGEH